MTNVDEDHAASESRRPRWIGLVIGLIILLLVITCLLLARSCWPGPAPSTETDIAQLASVTHGLTQSATLDTETPGTTTSPLTPSETGGTPPGGATPATNIPGGPTSTGTPCSPPPGWVVHEIRPGDTLFSLANATNTTVEAIMQANCMEDDQIVAYERIYLPERPPAPPPPPPQPAVQPTRAPSTPGVHVPSLNLAAGGGNNEDDVLFVPCAGGFTSPQVQALGNRDTMEIGERQYFYACGFSPSSVVVSATVTLPDGSPLQANLYDEHPNDDLQKGSASKIIEWPAIPGQPTGWYSMVLTDNLGNATPPFPFRVDAPTKAHILPMPALGLIGKPMQIYYVFFDYQSVQTFMLFGEKQATETTDHTLDFLQQWEVPIIKDFKFDNLTYNVPAGKGWAVYELPIPSSYQPGAYAITDLDRILNYLFWITQ